jgi:molybdopterin-guanine dinucleotide biosynthesis protein A
MEGVRAFILAGGRSTRMGTDKAFLEFFGRSLLNNALALAREAVGQVCIVGDAAKFSPFGPVISDIYPNRGPLGGIHAALASSDAELNLVLGVDLPFLTARFLRHLISLAENSQAAVSVPFVNGHYEPLCAVYRKSFVRLADAALAEHRNKIDALFTDVAVRTVDDDELATLGFSPAMFRNLNTPEDWERARREFADHLNL